MKKHCEALLYAELKSQNCPTGNWFGGVNGDSVVMVVFCVVIELIYNLRLFVSLYFQGLGLTTDNDFAWVHCDVY